MSFVRNLSVADAKTAGDSELLPLNDTDVSEATVPDRDQSQPDSTYAVQTREVFRQGSFAKISYKPIREQSTEKRVLPTSTANLDARNILQRFTFEAEQIIRGQPLLHPVEKTRSIRHRPLQKWQGTVMEITADGFTARLRDLTLSNVDVREVGQFKFSEIANSDRKLVKPGAIFYWSVSRVVNKAGKVEPEHMIYFKRSVPYTEKKIEKIMNRAKELHEFFKFKKDRPA